MSKHYHPSLRRRALKEIVIETLLQRRGHNTSRHDRVIETRRRCPWLVKYIVLVLVLVLVVRIFASRCKCTLLHSGALGLSLLPRSLVAGCLFESWRRFKLHLPDFRRSARRLNDELERRCPRELAVLRRNSLGQQCTRHDSIWIHGRLEHTTVYAPPGVSCSIFAGVSALTLHAHSDVEWIEGSSTSFPFPWPLYFFR